jgi:hypothetical protein
LNLEKFIKDNMPSKKNLTLMAKQVGTTQQNVSNWLERERIPCKYLFEVADFLEIEPRLLRSKMKY